MNMQTESRRLPSLYVYIYFSLVFVDPLSDVL